MSNIISGIVLMHILWIAFAPRSYGREMRSLFDKIKEGWTEYRP